MVANMLSCVNIKNGQNRAWMPGRIKKNSNGKMADNVQVKRRWPEGPMCRSSPGGAQQFFLPVRDPDKASGGRGA